MPGDISGRACVMTTLGEDVIPELLVVLRDLIDRSGMWIKYLQMQIGQRVAAAIAVRPFMILIF